MRRIAAIVLLLAAATPAHAFFGDSVISAARWAKQEAYQAFMKVKMIEQLRVLKENYDASMRYYREFQRLNKGKGFFHNVADQIRGGGEQLYYELESQINYDFIHTYNTNTRVDRLFRAVDHKIEGNLKYAAKGMIDLAFNREQGQKIAQDAKGLSPQDAANLSAKAQGLQLQMLAQIHEDNLRLIELQSMRLAAENRKEKQRLELMQSLRRGVERRAPGAAPAEER